jgi:hypothetical protein
MVELMEMIKAPQIMQKEKYQGLASNDQESYIKKKILEFLDLNSNGVTVPDIKDSSPFSTQTIIKHLERFVSSGQAYKIKRRNLTTYYLNGRPDHPEISVRKLTELGNEFKVKVLNNNFGEFAYIEYKTSVFSGGILIKLDDIEFMKELIIELLKEIERRDK